MANENPEQNIGSEDQPQFNVEKIYTRDISFESPNSPHVFMTADAQPKIDMNLHIENQRIDDDHWEVALKTSVLARNSQDQSVMFEIEVEQAGVFLLKNIPEEHLPALLGADCPTVIFPYTRQIVSQLTSDGGFLPLLLEPLNFAALYQSNLAQQQPQTTN